MKIYIAGKISGDNDYKAKFQWVVERLEANRHIVLNPAALPEGLKQVDYMRICFAMLEAAEFALFLPDYQESKGAMLEWDWCRKVGKRHAIYADIADYLMERDKYELE